MVSSVTPAISLYGVLKERIESHTARIGVIGLGYVGLPLSLLFSNARFRVDGFDVDPSKVEKLEAGESYICRITGDEIKKAQQQGFAPTFDYSKIGEMDIVIICVPTPLNEYHEPDLSYIESTARSIAPHLKAGQLVVMESTTYPGTTEEVLIPILEKGNNRGLRASRGGNDEKAFFVAFSPEREDPGNETHDRKDVPKVVGGVDKAATDLACRVYNKAFRTTVAVSSPAAAEMTKLLENIYRCVNIALVNELKQLCMRMGIDIWEVIEAAKTKPFGFQPFYPGPGLGGHCIPIDPFYLSWKAKEYDFRTKFIELAGEVNVNMPYFVVQSTVEALNKHGKALNGSRVLVLGLAYKKDIDDLRESPSLTIIELLQKGGAVVNYNDPFFPKVGHGRHYNFDMTCVSIEEVSGYDCVLIVTDHSAYDYAKIVSQAKLVIDTRNATKNLHSEKIVHC